MKSTLFYLLAGVLVLGAVGYVVMSQRATAAAPGGESGGMGALAGLFGGGGGGAGASTSRTGGKTATSSGSGSGKGGNTPRVIGSKGSTAAVAASSAKGSAA